MSERQPSCAPDRSAQKQHVCAALIAKLASFLGTQDEVIDPLRPLAEYGIDSTDLLTLVFDIEEQFRCKFPPSTFFDIETVEELAERIAAALAEQGIHGPEATSGSSR